MVRSLELLYGESYWGSKNIKFCAHYAWWCVDSLKHWGIKVTIKQEEDIAIPAFTGTFREEHMKPNELGGKE